MVAGKFSRRAWLRGAVGALAGLSAAVPWTLSPCSAGVVPEGPVPCRHMFHDPIRNVTTFMYNGCDCRKVVSIYDELNRKDSGLTFPNINRRQARKRRSWPVVADLGSAESPS